MSADGEIEDADAPRITLDRDHHNGHLNEEKEGFDPCVPVIVHCRSEAEARQMAKGITDDYNGGESE